ncbi:MAG: exodeoxyribonuclease VII small subunit [Marinifilaceae bacterium]|jgi:exodeoxyribonuclease VII small subunit
MSEELTYRAALKEIEESVNKIEQEDVDVDELSTLVKRVSELLKFCKAKLYSTEQEIDEVLKNMNDNE